MSTLGQDIRYAVRMLTKSPGFSAVVVLTLTLGIGLNTAVFSAVHALLLRPLPGAEEPDRLVQLYRRWTSDFLFGSNSIPHFFSIKEENDVFESVTAWTLIGAAVGILGGVFAARLLQGLLYTDSALDPFTFAVVPAVLLAAAALATYVPAKRAASVDPVTALKSE